MPLLSLRLLLLLLFCRDRGIDFQHALGKVHAHLPLRKVYAFQVRLGERYIKLLAGSVGNNQQRRFAGSELYIFNSANFTRRDPEPYSR